jgi:glycosyltransferase involved in cell wall biosynthesis
MNISVIIPTKNRHELLKSAINSVINQKDKPYEVIIIDGSSDNQTMLSNKKISENKGFKYIKQNYKKI